MFIYIFFGAIIGWLIYHQVVWYLAVPQFKNKVVLITGASSGIGEEITKQMAKLDTKKIIICARRVEEL